MPADLPSMFEHSRSLLCGAKIIFDSDGISGAGEQRIPTIPVIISCALSAEISLKLICYAEGGSPPKTHDIFALYDGLSATAKSGISAIYAENGDADEVREFIGMLEKHKLCFLSWRYPFEGGEPQASPTFLYSLAYALSCYIEKTYSFERNMNGWLKASAHNNSLQARRP